jgi:hypothetical protein
MPAQGRAQNDKSILVLTSTRTGDQCVEHERIGAVRARDLALIL